MRFLKNVFSQMHRWVLWALISVMFWAWIYTFVNDTTPARKLTLYAQVDLCEDEALTRELEKSLPSGIKMVKVHPFSYAMFDDGDLQGADLYVVRSSEAERFLEDFAPLEETGFVSGERELYRSGGRAYGVKIFDAASGEGAAKEYFFYGTQEDYYLFFNADSLHLEDGDGAALWLAETLLNLP